MSATEDLNALAVRKAAIRARIAARRREMAATAHQLARPVALAERGFALWRSIPGVAKWAAVPAGWLVGRVVAKRVGGVKVLLRYAPVGVAVAKSVQQLWRARRNRDFSTGENALHP